MGKEPALIFGFKTSPLLRVVTGVDDTMIRAGETDASGAFKSRDR